MNLVCRREDSGYLKEPDVFNEIYGNCKLLVNSDFSWLNYCIAKFNMALS